MSATERNDHSHISLFDVQQSADEEYVGFDLEILEDQLHSHDEDFDLEELDVISLYLREIGSIPLLTVEQEKEYAIQLEKGKDAENVIHNNPSLEEDAILKQDIEAGQEARSMLIQGNCRLVVYIAKRYKDKGVDFIDLIQQGNIGLIKAVDKYDYRKGRVSTYASFWIKQQIARFVKIEGNESIVGYRSNTERVFKKNVSRVEEELTGILHRQPTEKEIADVLQMPLEEFQRLGKGIYPILEFDKEVFPESDRSFADSIASSDNVESEATDHLNIEKIKQLLCSQNISPRTRVLLSLKFGIFPIESPEFMKLVSESGLDYEDIYSFSRQNPDPSYHQLANIFHVTATAIQMRIQVSFDYVRRSLTK